MTEEISLTSFPEIIFQDADLLILYKPAGWFVHPPENRRFRRGLKRKTCVQWLSDVHQIKASPAHRIDVATQGLVIFGLNKISTAHLNQQFKNHTVNKTYLAAVRGWFKEKKTKITLDLELDSTQELVPCETQYEVLSEIELPYQINSKFKTTRYSLLKVKPITGRWHQIRRHMNRVAHPILGDREHGDSHHNRFFRDQLHIAGLCLFAYQIEFTHPTTLELMSFKSLSNENLKKISQLFLLEPF